MGYKGHIINLPQDITELASRLSQHPRDLSVLIIRKEGAQNSHRDFRVRKLVVLNALEWLKKNNKYYRHITLDYDVLDLLPSDGDLTNHCGVVVDDTTDVTDEPQEDNNSVPEDAGSFVPILAQKKTEEQTIRNAVHSLEQGENNKHHVIPWPETGTTPINEFTTEGYFSRAFPTLFPTGASEFLAPRHNPVTIGHYFKHLLMYGNGRFAKHPRFRYCALNTEMRWRALQTGRVYIKQYPQDSRMTLDELSEMVGQGDGESFTKRVLHFSSSLRGTSHFWLKQRNRLIAMIDSLGMPTIFFTHSSAYSQ